MLRLTYLIKNFTRNPLRTLLTCAAVALPITIYVLAMAVVNGIDRFLENSSQQLRLAVANKASIIIPLPVGYRARIEALDHTKTRLLSVNGVRFIGGRIEGNKTPLSTLAVDVDTFLPTFPEVNLTPEERDEWHRRRNAIIVGAGTREQFGWPIGARITIRLSFPPYTAMEFHVVAESHSTTEKVTNFCRRDYLQAEIERVYGDIAEDFVSFYFVKCASQADLDHFRVAIDQEFAGSTDETKTQDEKTFMNDLIRQQFDLKRNLAILGLVTVFVAVMAATNTMSMNFRDRLNELGTLKALGFSSSVIFGLIQSESLLLCAAGGVLGALLPYVAFTHTPLREVPVPLILHLEIHRPECVQGMLIALVVGLASGLWPSWSAFRLKPVTALRTLE